VLLFGVPVAVAAVIVRHPPDPATATDLGPLTNRYIWIHVALLFLLPLLGIVVWKLLEGMRGFAVSFARVAVAFALVFYAAFDALIGVAAGLLSREATAMDP
jgi:hypothetical protein